MILLILITVVQSCPIWKCAELDEGVCAEWNEQVVRVNTKKCPSGQFCYLLGLELEKNWKVEGRAMCEEFDMVFESEPINCGVWRVGEGYGREHPIRCRTDADCVLRNGRGRNCVCAMDGNSYCEVAEDDGELVNYNAYCLMLGVKEAFAWYLYIDLFPVLHGVPGCATGLFRDLKVVQTYSGMLGIEKNAVFQG